MYWLLHAAMYNATACHLLIPIPHSENVTPFTLQCLSWTVPEYHTGIPYCDVGCHTLIRISHSEAVPTDVPHSRFTALLPVPEIAKIDKHSNASHIRKHTMKHTY